MAKEFVNAGFLHAVKCEWCGLAMSCNCWDGSQSDREGHILVLCPRCQVTDFLNLLFGEKDLRSILVSKIKRACSEKARPIKPARPRLRLIVADARTSLKSDTSTKS